MSFKKLLIISCGLIIFPALSFGAVLFYENFDYSNGEITSVSNGNWGGGTGFTIYNQKLNANKTGTGSFIYYTETLQQWNQIKQEIDIDLANSPYKNVFTYGFAYTNEGNYWTWETGIIRLNLRADTNSLWIYGQKQDCSGVTYLEDIGYEVGNNIKIETILNLEEGTYKIKKANGEYSNTYQLIRDINNQCYYPNNLPKHLLVMKTNVQDTQGNRYNSITIQQGIINGLCGSSNGIVSNIAPADNLCSSGTAGGVYPTATGWSWTCFPVGLGQISSCSATLGENPEEGLCGPDNGQLLSNPPTNFCTDGLLVIGSQMETPAKYLWQCAGSFSGITVNCYADKSIINYPTPTPLEDCNTLDFFPALVCEIKNMIAGAFTPSIDAIDNLNQALYKIKNKAPFNYIYSFEIQVDNLSVVENKKMNICIMDNCGDITVFDLLAVKIKSALYFLFSIGFVFYLINYIKRFFL